MKQIQQKTTVNRMEDMQEFIVSLPLFFPVGLKVFHIKGLKNKLGTLKNYRILGSCPVGSEFLGRGPGMDGFRVSGDPEDHSRLGVRSQVHWQAPKTLLLPREGGALAAHHHPLHGSTPHPGLGLLSTALMSSQSCGPTGGRVGLLGQDMLFLGPRGYCLLLGQTSLLRVNQQEVLTPSPVSAPHLPLQSLLTPALPAFMWKQS